MSNNNIGSSTRSQYDTCAYRDRLHESVSPLLYRLNANDIANCDACLSTLGPRSSSPRGFGVSTTSGFKPAISQEIVDVESVLTNRNVPLSKCRKDQVNFVDVTKFGMKDARICDDYLNPLASRLTYPAATYRGMAIDRFYDLPRNPQSVVYWDTAINSRLEAKDNYCVDIPSLRVYDPTMPPTYNGVNRCQPHYVDGATCPNETCGVARTIKQV